MSVEQVSCEDLQLFQLKVYVTGHVHCSIDISEYCETYLQFFLAMNISLIQLSLSSLSNSPFISNSKDSFILLKSTFSYHFSPLYFSKHPKAEFNKINFRHFLSVPVHVTSYKKNEKTFTEFTEFKDEEKVKITKCIFYQCNNKNMNTSGGAIFIQNWNTSLSVMRTGFIYCKSSLMAGAVYACCNDIDMTMTCFEENRALKGAQSFYINAYNAHFYQAIISECGLKLNPLKITTFVYNSSFSMDNSNISSNRFVTNENGLSLIDCSYVSYKYNYMANNLGNGLLFISYIGETSNFELCNIINNTGTDDLPMIYVRTKLIDFRKFIFKENTFPMFIETDHSERITFVLCKFDSSIETLGTCIEVTQKQCHFDLDNIKLHTINYPMPFRCYALGATDPPELAYPTQTPLPAPGIQRHQKPPEPQLPPYIPPPTFNWMPPGMAARQYGLILFASIITPICVVIHCITTRGSRDIQAINDLR